MEEQNIISTEAEESWDDIDLSDVSDSTDDWDEDGEATEAEGETDTSEEDAADHSDEAEAEAEPVESQPETVEKEEADHSFTLKYMGEEKQFSREETIALAQKGMDYERIRGKLNEASEMVDFVNTISKEMNLSPQQFMTEALAGHISKRENISLEEAKRRIELDRREKAISDKEAAVQEAANKENQEANQRRERIKTELAEFARAYPGVKPESLPKEVFTIAAKTQVGLAAAYAMHLAEEAKAALETEKKNAENRAKSVGSSASSGKRKSDAFDDAWYDGT